jgi:hypothetical protein
MKIKVTWDFEGTEFETLQYEEARKQLGLPSSVNVDLDEDEYEDPKEYLEATYSFYVLEYEED